MMASDTLPPLKGLKLRDEGSSPTSSSMAALIVVFRVALSWEDRVWAGQVCKEWRRSLHSLQVWQSLDLRDHAAQQQVLQRLPQLHSSYAKLIREVRLQFAMEVQDLHLEAMQRLQLQKLTLNACHSVTGKGIAALLASQPGLRQLSLYWSPVVSDTVLLTLCGSCTALTHLSLSGCSAITDDGLCTLTASLPGLISLDLTRCLKVKDRGFSSAAKWCKGLRELRMYACAALTDQTLTQLGTHLHDLRVLDCCGANAITDAGIKSVANGCRQLRYLNLTWCIKVTNTSLARIGECCVDLQWLSLHGLQGVSIAGLQQLSAPSATKLHTLDVQGCNLTKDERDSLLELFPRVRTWKVHG